MLEPQIVFCKNNHIYDKSLDEECPYCKQIEERRKRLTVEVNGRSRPQRQDFGEEFTEQSDEEPTEYRSDRASEDDETEYDDSATEYMDSETEYDDSETEYADSEIEFDDSETEYRDSKPEKDNSRYRAGSGIRQTKKPEKGVVFDPYPAEERRVQSGQDREPKREVIGWLVCVESKSDYGETFELRNGSNYILFDQYGRLSIRQDLSSGDQSYAKIYRDPVTLRFQIERGTVSGVLMDERVVTDKMILRPYSDIIFPQAKVMFYPLVGLYGFEWRHS